jgi:hypothetical protein
MEISSQKILFVDLNDQQINDREMTTLLYSLTGHIYSFAVTSSMRWGKDGVILHSTNSHPDGFYQLMPDPIDDGFFDWYCYYRDDRQFFEAKENAVLHFIYFWQKWTSSGKPNPFLT